MASRPALKEGEFGPSKAAEGFFVHGLLAGFHESLVELSVAIDDGLLGPSQAVLIHLASGLVLVCFKTPGLGLALHELLGLDDLADLLEQQVVHQDGVCPRDDLAELADDFLDRLAGFRNMRVGILRLSGAELLARIGELVPGGYHLLGAQSPERAARLGQGDGPSLFVQPVGLEVVQEKGESAFHRGHATAYPVLAIYLAAEPLLGGQDAVGPILFLLRGEGEGEQARGGEGQGEKDATCFHCLLLHWWFRFSLRFSVARLPSGPPAPGCGSASVLRSELRILRGTSLNRFRV